MSLLTCEKNKHTVFNIENFPSDLSLLDPIDDLFSSVDENPSVLPQQKKNVPFEQSPFVNQYPVHNDHYVPVNPPKPPSLPPPSNTTSSHPGSNNVQHQHTPPSPPTSTRLKPQKKKKRKKKTKPRSKPKPNQKLECPHCQKIFDSNKKYKRHIKQVHLKKHKCEFPGCNKTFGEKWDLKTHLRTHEIEGVNNGRIRFPCKHCQKSFTEKCSFKRHIQSHHGGEKPFQCIFCNKRFVR